MTKQFMIPIFRISLFLFLLLPSLSQAAFFVKKQSPLPAPTLNPEAAHEMKKEKGYWIEVQVPQRMLVLAKGDHIIKTFSVAVGMPDYPSPKGWRKIDRIVWNPWWYPPRTSKWVEDPTPVPPRKAENPLGEIKMPLGEGHYLIHGTRAVSSIGTWASHGCIRMLFEDIFGLVQLMLTNYSRTSAIEMMEKANLNPSTEFYTSLDHSVPVFFSYDPIKINGNFVTISPDVYKRAGDMSKLVVQAIAPHLKDNRVPSIKKINGLLKMFPMQTVNVPMESLSMSGKGEKKEKDDVTVTKQKKKKEMKKEEGEEKKDKGKVKKAKKEKVKKDDEEEQDPEDTAPPGDERLY